MNPDHLSNDEFTLECEVRNIVGDNPLNNLNELLKRLEDEKDHPVLAPNRPLISAQKNPRREVKRISLKFRDIYNSLENVVDQKASNLKENIAIFHSRILHINSCLYRLEYSKVVNVDVKELQDKCNQLIEFMNKFNDESNPSALNESITQLAALNLQDTDGTPSSNHGSQSEGEFSEESEESGNNLQPPRCNQLNNTRIVNEPGPSHIEQSQTNDYPHLSDQESTSRHSSKVKKRTSFTPAVDRRQKNQQVFDQPPLKPPVSATNYFVPNRNQFYHSQPYHPIQRDPRKWPISFDGTATGTPVIKFIRMVEHQAMTNCIHLQQIANDMSYFLKGLAADWYWDFIQRNGNCDWTVLKTELVKRFADRRTDLEIRRGIESKKQRPNEKFIDFYHAVLSLSLQMDNPMPDAELIFIITQNMRPGLQDRLAITQFTSLDDLVRQGVAYEDTWTRNRIVPETFCESRKYVHTFEATPDPIVHATQFVNQVPINYQNQVPYIAEQYASGIDPNHQEPIYYQAPHRDMTNHNYTFAPPMVNAISTNYNVLQNGGPDETTNNNLHIIKHCWNCRLTGHYFKSCNKRILHTFCFGCGTPDVLKTYCHNCRYIRGNGQEGVNIPRMVTPNTSTTSTAQNKNGGFRLIRKQY